MRPGWKKPPRVFHGNLSDYLDKKAAEREALAAKASSLTGGGNTASAGNRKEQRKLEARQRQERSTRLKPLQEKLETVEQLISDLEAEKPKLLGKLADPEFFKEEPDLARVTAQRYKDLENDLQKAYTDWDEVSGDLDRAVAELGAE